MLYREIQQGCRKYHANPKAYDKYYKDYLYADRDDSKWDNPDTLDLAESGKIMGFLNLWDTPMHVRLIDFLPALRKSTFLLNSLKTENILELNFGEAGQLISEAFDTVATCGPRCESTAASKILHTVNPNLFVMWDGGIRKKYAEIILKRKKPLESGVEYAFAFLPKMQAIAKSAVCEVMNEENCSRDDAIDFLTPCSNTLAKVLDEFNFAVVKNLKD